MEKVIIVSYILSFLASFGVIIWSWKYKDRSALEAGILLLVLSILVGFISGLLVVVFGVLAVVDDHYSDN